LHDDVTGGSCRDAGRPSIASFLQGGLHRLAPHSIARPAALHSELQEVRRADRRFPHKFCKPETVLNLSSNGFVARENRQTFRRSELYCSENLHREPSFKLPGIV
jgi:hypothetical protein